MLSKVCCYGLQGREEHGAQKSSGYQTVKCDAVMEDGYILYIYSMHNSKDEPHSSHDKHGYTDRFVLTNIPSIMTAISLQYEKLMREARHG